MTGSNDDEPIDYELTARGESVTSPPGPAMLTVGGKRFACHCGCNVFTPYRGNYLCNACGVEYG